MTKKHDKPRAIVSAQQHSNGSSDKTETRGFPAIASVRPDKPGRSAD